MKTSLNRSKSLNQRNIAVGTPRSFGIGTSKWHRFGSFSRQFISFLFIIALLFFTVGIACSYFFLLPHLPWGIHSREAPNLSDSTSTCDYFDGYWTIDDTYPLYNASSCPFAEKGFNCLGNGRKDKDYLRWKWKPKNCILPRFNVTTLLNTCRNKRIVFVGDSMSRTQWESLICILMNGVEDKSTVYEVHNKTITKQTRYLCVKFSSFNFTVEFFRSVFLVEQNTSPKHAPRRVKSTLKIDTLDEINKEWINSDALIVNTGQWWVSWKLFEMGCYFQVGDAVKLGMPISSAYRMAVETWARWVKENVDARRTRVFFRTYEPSHWSVDKSGKLCNVSRMPMKEEATERVISMAETVGEVVRRADVAVTVLQVTSMSAWRSDAHVGKWNDDPSTPDCSHWCLPGLPDVWNEIFLSIWFA